MTPLHHYGWSGDLPTTGTLARVIKEFQHIYHIVTASASGTDVVRSEAIVTGQFRHHVTVRSDYPVVGDWVIVSGPQPDGRFHIEERVPRHNSLSRLHKHYNHEEQVLVSNVDIAFIMVSIDGYRQDNENRLNRFIQLVTQAGISPIILCNKMDLAPADYAILAPLKEMVSPYLVIPIQAKFNKGINDVQCHISAQKTAIVLGVSGVGKSTLINQLFQQEVQAVHIVRKKDQKGMHTTRNRELFRLPNSGLIIDTPGIKSLVLWGDDKQLKEHEGDQRFDHIRDLSRACKFSNCTHQHEPHCAVKAAVESGELDEKTLAMFLKR